MLFNTKDNQTKLPMKFLAPSWLEIFNQEKHPYIPSPMNPGLHPPHVNHFKMT
jgi:hypothetical protein